MSGVDDVMIVIMVSVDPTNSELSNALFAEARRIFHASLVNSGLLSIDSDGIPSNADRSQAASTAYATRIAKMVLAETTGERLVSQTSGKKFEEATAAFLSATFLNLTHLRPGNWEIRKITSRGRNVLSDYAQYSHLGKLAAAAAQNPSLLSMLGNAYAISPDVVIARRPVADVVINAVETLVDSATAERASIRARYESLDYLHAVVSCKWTLRSDRAQNARSEALNLVRNRNGPLPHIVVVTAEPTPSRLSSLALGTGDIDCVYHFALPELLVAVREAGGAGDRKLLEAMVDGGRLKDVADLPLDLAL